MDLVLSGVRDYMTLHLHSPRRMSDDEFWNFCQANPNLRVERTADREIVVMPPAGFESGGRNLNLGSQLFVWAKKNRRGQAFDSNTAYILPSGAILSPDASWVSNAKIRSVSPFEKEKFPHLCPDFVIELMSPSDRVKTAQNKMCAWIDNGVELAWLIDPKRRRVHIYRQYRDPEILDGAGSIAGEPPVSGFVLELDEIWAGL